MKPHWLAALAISFGLVAAMGGSAQATTVKISPLRYDAALKEGEKQKGFVDVSNPSATTETIRFTVQAFRQSDNDGNLEFYNDERLTKGILLDYSEVTLAPREVLHLAFIIDGSVLPQGDVFAAIFATSVSPQSASAAQSAQVGSLLFIANGSPNKHSIAVERLNMLPVQVGRGITARFALSNLAQAGTVNAHAPQVKVAMWPFISDTVAGPLVFAGKSRQVDYVKQGDYFGIVRLSVATETGSQAAYGFVMTGYWRWVAPIALGLVGLAGAVIIWLRRRR